MWGFRRRDTALMASSVGGLAAALVVAAGPGMLGFGGWRLMLAALVVALGSGGLIVWLRRRFPRDVDLVWLGATEQALLVASRVPVDRAMLCVVLRPSWGSRYRLEVFLDDTRLGQLRPGTAFLLPIQPGPRRLTLFNGTRGGAVSERFEAIAGVEVGFQVRSMVGRGTYIDIARDMVPRQGIRESRLLRPLVPEA